MCLLSVIVPVYNTEMYLKQCVDSILSQTYQHIELILVDDGSTDNSGKICDQYAEKDRRIQVIHQVNQGVSAARNAALDIAKGEFLGFVDSDDWVDPDMYQVLIQKAEDEHADVVACGMRVNDESGRGTRNFLNGEGEYNQTELLKGLFDRPNQQGGSCCNKIYRRALISDIRYNPSLIMAEDWIYLFMCYERFSKGVKIPESFYNVRERRNSATREDVIQASYEIMTKGKSGDLLLSLARAHSKEIEKCAVEKYIDDGLRYSSVIRKEGTKSGRPYFRKFLLIRLRMIRPIVRALVYQLLPISKIKNYLVTMLFYW